MFGLEDAHKNNFIVEVGKYNPGITPWVLRALDPGFWPHFPATKLWPATVRVTNSWFLCQMREATRITLTPRVLLMPIHNM